MKIALQRGLIPGKTTAAKAKWAADHGVAGIELGVFNVSNAELRQQTEEINGLVPISSVCANATPDGTPTFTFLDGFMAYKCGNNEEKAANLAKSLDYVRLCIDKA